MIDRYGVNVVKMKLAICLEYPYMDFNLLHNSTKEESKRPLLHMIHGGADTTEHPSLPDSKILVSAFLFRAQSTPLLLTCGDDIILAC